jgi:hypothetical protein
MPGLVPGIHAFLVAKTWMAGTSPGHDKNCNCLIQLAGARLAPNARLPCRANSRTACYEAAVSESPARSGPASPSTSAALGARQWYARGLFAGITSVQGYVLFASYVGFGGLCAGIGFPMGAAIFSSFLIAALPSQLLLVGGYVAGNGALVIALAVLLSAARLLPAVVTLLPYLRGRLSVQLFAAHFVR